MQCSLLSLSVGFLAIALPAAAANVDVSNCSANKMCWMPITPVIPLRLLPYTRLTPSKFCRGRRSRRTSFGQSAN